MRALIVLIVVISINTVVGQTNNIGVKYQDGILVKWVYPDFYAAEPIDIYRSEDDGPWQKINENIIIQDLEINDQRNNKEKTCISIIRRIRDNNLEGEGLAKLFVLSEIVESNDLATTLGMFYKDTGVESNIIYKYQIRGHESENIIAESKTIQIEEEYDAPRVKNPRLLYVNADGARFKWDHIENQYFGINVYRKARGDQASVKINDTPVLVFKYQDELGIYRFPDEMFIDTSMVEGIPYIYNFRTIDIFGEESQPSVSVTAQLENSEKPEPVSDIQTSLNSTNLSVTWEKSKSLDVEKYRVTILDPAGSLLKEETTELASYNFDPGSPGQYFIEIRAVDYAGLSSEPRIADGLIPDVFPTSQVSGLEMTFDESSGKVALSWQAVPEQEDLFSYRVLRYTSNQGSDADTIEAYSYISPNLVRETAFVDDIPLETQTKYRYAVVAVDTVNNISLPSYSDWVTIPDIVPPMPPVITKAVETEKGIKLQWLPANDYDVDFYEVYRMSDIDNKSVLVSTVENNRYEYYDDNVEEGQKLFYHVIAQDLSKNRSQPSNIYPVQKRKTVVNSQQIDLKLKVDYDSKKAIIKAKWDAFKEEQMKGYILYQRKNDKRFVPVTGLIKKNKIERNKNLNKGTYQYQVRLYTEKGDILHSKIMSITVDK